MYFVEEECTASNSRSLAEVLRGWGQPSSLYTDRGSHYWSTPEADGTVDRGRPTQLGRAMRQFGVQMIPAYSPEARGRCERMFGTHHGRLSKELAARGSNHATKLCIWRLASAATATRRCWGCGSSRPRERSSG